VARVRSILRVKALHDTVQEQAAQLGQWSSTLEQRVSEQLAELERLTTLKRFLSPQVAELIVSSGDDRLLGSHRREIDLRGFIAFAETTKPEDVMDVIREYHDARTKERSSGSSATVSCCCSTTGCRAPIRPRGQCA
jgi:adenylate cyclase